MKITRRQLRRIIMEAMPSGGVPDVVGAVTGVYGEENRQQLDDYGSPYDYYKDKEKDRNKAHERFAQALEEYEALPPDSPEKRKMKARVEKLRKEWFDAGYVGD